MSEIAYSLKFDHHSDITQNFMVKKLLESSTKDIRLPITANILENILDVLPVVFTNTYEAKLFAYHVTFFGYFRVGEITEGRAKNIQMVMQFSITSKFPLAKFDENLSPAFKI